MHGYRGSSIVHSSRSMRDLNAAVQSCQNIDLSERCGVRSTLLSHPLRQYSTHLIIAGTFICNHFDRLGQLADHFGAHLRYSWRAVESDSFDAVIAALSKQVSQQSLCREQITKKRTPGAQSLKNSSWEELWRNCRRPTNSALASLFALLLHLLERCSSWLPH